MLRRILLGLIDLYRKGISPFTPPSCRFVPTCSTYAHEAISKHGAMRGGWLFLKRFARCHPFGAHGFDPVPAATDREPRATSDAAARRDMDRLTDAARPGGFVR